ncbi:Z1 domain-containing protein [Candidatus Woesearchaeota archaeon]|nr:Z1 domain-containing protein [Candidatus Woesearchaeota archaeon]
MNYAEALGLARFITSTGISIDEAVDNPVIPSDFRKRIRLVLEEEKTIILRPASMLTDDKDYVEWLSKQDRSGWYYWPTLRQYILTTKGWPNPSVQSLDKETDRILARLPQPNGTNPFDKKGLVLGYVQSGKTSNYTALIAKAADSGYRLIIVLSGIDNGLRLQTHRRLKREIVGTTKGKYVPLPPIGKQWFEFTREELDGDFDPGFTNNAALQGSQPVLLVVKKNGFVLRRLLKWLKSAPKEVMQTIPLIVIDDEADLASIDTRGSYQPKSDEIPENYEDPSVINELIRDLLNRFNRKVYIAYTATPFANILIPHDNYDPNVSDDLYPKNFMVDLPKPSGYFGAEELFGRMDDISEDSIEGMDVIRNISDEDLIELQESKLPPAIERAILSFILAGAARKCRSEEDFPATMLIHISFRINDQLQIYAAVDKKFTELRDEWRYDRNNGILKRFQSLWEEDFQPVTEQLHPNKVIDFAKLEQYIGTFFESIQIRTINSATGEVLDYEAEPTLKTIAIGGNKLSRGLTLEGLLVSVFVRRTVMYDTLMQMGRWFGFRFGYEDLTRIYTTAELADWFRDLAFVEHQLRNDLQVFEEQLLTPLEVGMRIKTHPQMQVTSRLKRRYASETTIAQSYSEHIEQTFKFPLNKLGDLAYQADQNLNLVKDFLSNLGEPKMYKKGPLWSEVPAQKIVEFLNKYVTDEGARNISLPLISSYIEKQVSKNELIKWTIAVCGRESLDSNLGEVDWGLKTKIRQISRTRLGDSESLGVITSPGDESIGLSKEEIKKVNEISKEENIAENKAARKVRSPKEGLILIYPISRHSTPIKSKGIMRHTLYANSNSPNARDLIGIAISFPRSEHPQPVEAFLEGTISWRPVE